jgi:signal transduction histidine kinase
MTAGPPPSRTAATPGGGPRLAADARLISDLITEAQRHAPVSRDEHSPRLDLQAVERAFGRVILDERVRSGVIAARERTLRLSEASGRPSETLSLTFAADLFVAIAVDRGWRRRDAAELVAALAGVLGMASQEVSVQLLTSALRTPQLLELPPLVGLDVQLSMLLALLPAVEGSLWVRDESGRIECVLSVGETARTRRFRTVASQTIDGRDAEGDRGLIVGVPVRRWHSPWAALVVRVRSRELVEALLEEAAAAISPIAEREFLLRRNASHERTLVKASERRLSRLGFDLHDGALQHIAALAADIRHLRPQLGAAVTGQLDSVEKHVSELDRVLRELAHSLEPASLLRRPLERVIEAEINGLTERSGIDVRSRMIGDFGTMTHSQKIALIRVVQEAFTNIREHSNATFVEVTVTGGRSSVEVQIEDDGDGFEVTRTLQAAAQRGRLGLVGSSERVRLLGGSFDIRSRPGGPTTVSVTLPRWQPLVAEQDVGLQLAY